MFRDNCVLPALDPALHSTMKQPCQFILPMVLLIALALLGPSGAAAQVDPGTAPGYDPKEIARRVKYPPEALAEGLEGYATIQVYINEKGKVTSTVVEESSSEMFSEAALKGARKIRYTPARVKGKRVAGWAYVSVEFYVEGEEKGRKGYAIAKDEDRPVREWKNNVLRLPQPDRREGRISIDGSDGRRAEDVDIDQQRQIQATIPVDEQTIDNDPHPYEIIGHTKEPAWDRKELQSRLVYPEAARQAGIEGHVTVRVLVDTDGRVKRTIIDHSSSPLLEESALNAIKETFFTPAMDARTTPVLDAGMNRVKAWAIVTVEYTLEKKDDR